MSTSVKCFDFASVCKPLFFSGSRYRSSILFDYLSIKTFHRIWLRKVDFWNIPFSCGHELMATGKWDGPKIDFPEPYSMKSFYRKIIEQYGGTIPTPAKEERFAYRSEIETLHRRAHQALDNYFGNEKEGVQDKRDIVYERLWQEHKERLYDAGYRSVSQHDFRKDKNIGGNIAVHVRMGSGIPYEKAPELDFPGDLSVRKFYEDIIEKYGSKTEEHKQ